MSAGGIIVSSHQPHFFPWLGYFDKMAKADLFLVNDLAQLEKQSPMVRNRILGHDGQTLFINVTVDRRDLMQKPNREILLKNWPETRRSLIGKLRACYRRAPYFDAVWPQVETVLASDCERLIDLQLATIDLGRTCLGIETPMRLQSEMEFEPGETTSERLAKKLEAVGASCYLSGNGAKKYMNDTDFVSRGIRVVYQQFSYPVYPQVSGGDFVPNLSVLDILFNCGQEESARLFWDNVARTQELRTP